MAVAQYVYGVVPAGTAVPEDLRGLEDGEVRVVAHDAIAVALGEIDDERRLGRQDLLAHSRVVDTLAAAGPIVPARFGSVLPPDADAVDEVLAPYVEHLAELLAELEGMAQMNLIARYVDDIALAEIVTSDPEIAALRERTRALPEDATYDDRIRLGELVAHALDDKRAQDAEAILAVLAPLAADHRMRLGGDVDQLGDMSFLVADEQRAAFEDAAEQVAADLHSRVRLRLIGPVAPYDFVPED